MDVLNTCKCLCLVAVGGAVAFLAVDVHRTLSDGLVTDTLQKYNSVAVKLDAAAALNLKMAQDTNARTRAAAGESEKAVASARRSAEHFEKLTLPAVDAVVAGLKKAVDENSSAIQKAVGSVTTTVDELRPRVARNLDASEAAVKSVTTTVDEARPRLNRSLDDVDAAVNALKVNLAKPEVGESLDHIESILNSVEDGSKLVDAKIHELFDPHKQTFWQAASSTAGRFLLPEIWQWWITKKLPPKVKTVP